MTDLQIPSKVNTVRTMVSVQAGLGIALTILSVVVAVNRNNDLERETQRGGLVALMGLVALVCYCVLLVFAPRLPRLDLKAWRVVRITEGVLAVAALAFGPLGLVLFTVGGIAVIVMLSSADVKQAFGATAPT